MNRRGFLGTCLALAAAPAIVRASSLMPGRGLIVPRQDLWLTHGMGAYPIYKDGLPLVAGVLPSKPVRLIWTGYHFECEIFH